MLRYRHALRDAMAERHLEDALQRGLEAANDSFAGQSADSRSESWRSPLRSLASPPANRVKWLTAKELHVLQNYLGGPAGDASDAPDDTSDPAEESDDGAWSSGLAGDERFDLSHWLTLLRADVFSTVQASIVGRLRKRTDASTAIAQALEVLDVAGYTAPTSVYAELRAQLHLESLAALVLLMEVGAAEAVILIHRIGGDAAVTAIIGSAPRRMAVAADDEDDDAENAENEAEDEADQLREAIAPRLKAAIADPNTIEGAGRALLLDAVAARRKVNRAGFRREDRADPLMAASLRFGAAAVFDVIRELDRLTATLSAKAAGADFAGDTARFTAAFRHIYLGGAN
jgi:hypothetical protein